MKDLVQAFQENEKLENEVFAKLVFTYKKTFNESASQKFIVEDQLGREWMFKVGDKARDGAVAIYRIFKLFDIPTPEIHYLNLDINGESVDGSLQRFVKNFGTLNKFEISALPQSIIDQMVKNNIVSWLTGNHHVHVRQFLISGSGDKPDQLDRIDNTIEWFLVGRDRLEYDYETPILWERGARGYTKFWRRYFQGRINPDMNEALDFGRFVAELPDDFYVDFYARGVKNGLIYFPNVMYERPPNARTWRDFSNGTVSIPELYHPEEKATFIRRILARKNSLGNDIEVYLRGLAKKRKEDVQFTSKTDTDAYARKLTAKLKERDTHMNEIASRLEAIGPRTQATIIAPMSVRGYHAAIAFYAHIVYEPSLMSYAPAWEEFRSHIQGLVKEAKYETERKALAQIINRIDLDKDRFVNGASMIKSYGKIFRLQQDTQHDEN